MGSWWGAQEAQRGPCDRAHTAMIGRPEPGTIGQPPGGLYVDAPPHRRRLGPPPSRGAAIPPTSLAPCVPGMGTASSFGR